MNYKMCAVIISAALFATAATAPSLAQSDMEDPQAEGLHLIELSRELHDRAIETSDPVLMLSAARLRKDAGMEPGELGELDTGGADLEKPETSAFGWEQWLDEAVRLSGGSAIIAGLAEDIRLAKSKGLVDPPVYTEALLPARSQHRYSKLTFRGGEFAAIRSEGLGNADIDMFVRDARGAIVCSQTDPSNVNHCRWTPDATGPFQVTLENKSDFADSYALTTN